jgi:pimeloyl-ACP methyl ester carboxylesterase
MSAALNSCPALPEPATDALARTLESLFATFDSWLGHEAIGVARPAPQVGRVTEMRLASDPAQRYYLYIPRGDSGVRRLFVTVHGISRNAEEHALAFAALAERYGLVVVAPLFDEARYPDYQRLGRSGKGERADLMLDRIVAEAAHWSGADATRFHLFGYSGGGQFAHRYALARPERIAAYAIGAAGWYTLPDATQKYPMGTRASERLPDLRFDADRFLAVPAAVFVGERDVHDGTALRQSEQLRAEQGENRQERGRNWIEAMRRAARAGGHDTAFHFETLPRSPHCFAKSMRRGGLGERVLQWMFDLPLAENAGRGDSDARNPVATPDRCAAPTAEWLAAGAPPVGGPRPEGAEALSDAIRPSHDPPPAADQGLSRQRRAAPGFLDPRGGRTACGTAPGALRTCAAGPP